MHAICSRVYTCVRARSRAHVPLTRGGRFRNRCASGRRRIPHGGPFTTQCFSATDVPVSSREPETIFRCSSVRRRANGTGKRIRTNPVERSPAAASPREWYTPRARVSARRREPASLWPPRESHAGDPSLSFGRAEVLTFNSCDRRNSVMSSRYSGVTFRRSHHGRCVLSSRLPFERNDPFSIVMKPSENAIAALLTRLCLETVVSERRMLSMTVHGRCAGTYGIRFLTSEKTNRPGRGTVV